MSYLKLAGIYDLVEYISDGEPLPEPTGRLELTLNPDGRSGHLSMEYGSAGGPMDSQSATFELDDNWLMMTRVQESTRKEYEGAVAPVECRLDCNDTQVTFTYLEPEGVIGHLFQVWKKAAS